MSNRFHLHILVSLLIAVGAGLIYYQHTMLGIPFSPEAKEEIWTVEANLVYDSRNRPAKLSMYLPQFQERFQSMHERFVSDGYGIKEEQEEDNRQVTWSIRKPEGRQSLYYTVSLAKMTDEKRLKKPGSTYTQKYQFSTPIEELAAQALTEEIRSKTADIHTFVTLAIRTLGDNENNNAQLLLDKAVSATARAGVLVKLLSHAHIPAQIIHAMPLKQGVKVEPKIWIRVYNGEQWLYFDIRNGDEGLPDDMLPWWQGEESVFTSTGAKNSELSFSVSKDVVNSMELARIRSRGRPSMFSDFSLSSLPVQTQIVYQTLLTVPLGVLVILFLRSFVGLITFGTFTPVLIALAFRETQLVWGIFLFTLITSIGLLVRFYLEQLRLLLVPRMAVILTVVVICMGLISIFGHKLGMDRGLSIALFPMVILTMAIERMSIIWEERGAAESIKTGIGSLIAASITYAIINIESLEHILFAFPGVTLILLALMLMIGRYSGYRLTELARFKALSK
ncbi:MAG: inactive transglutaminase family protein [Pseudomonadales bacterium]